MNQVQAMTVSQQRLKHLLTINELHNDLQRLTYMPAKLKILHKLRLERKALAGCDEQLKQIR